jgi:hypothetical protein
MDILESADLSNTKTNLKSYSNFWVREGCLQKNAFKLKWFAYKNEAVETQFELKKRCKFRRCFMNYQSTRQFDLH